MTLAKWDIRLLNKAIDEMDKALAGDGVILSDRLVACDLVAWLLQRDPSSRPSSADLILHHQFFEEPVVALGKSSS